MPKIGIRELKEQATAVVRSVREEGAEYVITLRGEPVARDPADHTIRGDRCVSSHGSRGVAAARPGAGRAVSFGPRRHLRRT